MKNLSIYKALGSCLLIIFLSGCSGCCKVGWPDLLHMGAEFTTNIINSEPDKTTMEFIGEFLNQAEEVAGKCECANGTGETNEQDVQWNVYYNPDEPANWTEPIDGSTLERSNLVACASDLTKIDVEFISSGYYLIENILDVSNTVKERNESNNAKEQQSKGISTFLKNEMYGNNRKYMIIKVETTNKKVYNEKGEPVNCRILKAQ